MTAKTFVPALVVVGIVSFLLGQRWPVRPLGTESPSLVLTTTKALPSVGLPGAQESGLLEKEREEPPKPPPGKAMETVGPAENVPGPLSAALKAKLESSFQNREKEKMVVLQNDQTDNGQTITLMIKRPNRGEVRNMLLGVIQDLGMDSSTSSVEAIEKALANELGDYTQFSACDPANPIWSGGFVPKYRVVSITFSDVLSELDVRYVDTMEEPEMFWDAGKKVMIPLGNTSNGTFTIPGAQRRFGHLFQMPGEGKLVAPFASASPEDPQPNGSERHP